jgi:predicted transcriptional regulator
MTIKERARQAARLVVFGSGLVSPAVAIIEQAITDAVKEKDMRIAELDAALAVFEDGASWDVYPGLRDMAIYEWSHDSDPRVLAQNARSNASLLPMCANCGHKKAHHFWGSREGCRQGDCMCEGFAATHSAGV